MKRTEPLIPLYTVWGKEVDKAMPHAEYPRPQLVRENWTNLNGSWDYTYTESTQAIPTTWTGQIVVPFSPESILSGVETPLQKKVLWYQRSLTHKPTSNKTILHFGAVDQVALVYLNQQRIGQHEGGFLPFSFDITEALQVGDNQLHVAVVDETEEGIHAYGKQQTDPGKIWYSPQMGIWQTVWLEEVPPVHIQKVSITPNFDEKSVTFKVVPNEASPQALRIQIFDGDSCLVDSQGTATSVTLNLPQVKAWSPDQPFLYDVTLTLGEDQVGSYFGMRKFSIMVDRSGHKRLALNNQPLFHNGLLDQGYWSDGMLTPPSDQAIIWELSRIKELGFNMLRKHIKIESLRWYYHCDRLGLIVWQDFVNGGAPYWEMIIRFIPFVGIHLNDRHHSLFGRKDPLGRQQFERDMEATVDHLYNTVSLSVWVPFNEGWGQFDSQRIGDRVKDLDPTRLVDYTSGWHDQGHGDFHSKHVYYHKYRLKKDKHDRIEALTEFGGYSLPTEGHMTSLKQYGYRMFESQAAFTAAYLQLYESEIVPQIPRGLSATVYTQVSDVEDEINGLFTYDRRVLKIDEAQLRALNQRLNDSLA